MDLGLVLEQHQKWLRRLPDGERVIHWEWLPGVCVPCNTGDQIRASCVQLPEIVKRGGMGPAWTASPHAS